MAELTGEEHALLDEAAAGLPADERVQLAVTHLAAALEDLGARLQLTPDEPLGAAAASGVDDLVETAMQRLIDATRLLDGQAGGWRLFRIG